MNPLSMHFNEAGQADSIDRDGVCLVHLNAGTERTVCNAPGLVADYNAMLARLESKPSPDAEGCSEERFDEIREQAFSENSAGTLMAAYREWYGTEGLGVLAREQLREDIERLMRHAVERAAVRVLALRIDKYNLWSAGWTMAIDKAVEAVRATP